MSTNCCNCMCNVVYRCQQLADWFFPGTHDSQSAIIFLLKYKVLNNLESQLFEFRKIKRSF